MADALHLEDGFDLDRLRRSGLYEVTSPQNGPGSFTHGYVEVMSGPVSGVARSLQIATASATGVRSTRTRVNGVWSSWVGVGGEGGGPDSTDDLLEGENNLYFTDARAQAALAATVTSLEGEIDGKIDANTLASTDDLPEGVNNLYFTDALAQAALAPALGDKLDADQVGTANGAASLDAGGLLPVAELPDEAVRSDLSTTLEVGYDTVSHPAGTFTTGTYTPDPADSNIQHATNNGAHTFAPPASPCSVIVEYVNGASAGAVTTSGFTLVEGEFTAVEADKFLCFVVVSNTVSYLRIVAV